MHREQRASTLSKMKHLGTILCLALLTACTAIPVEERASRRAEIDRQSEETIAMLTEKDPEFAEALEQSASYFTSRIASATLAVVGGGKGIGVLVDNQTGDRIYMDVKRLEFGAGLGARGYRLLLLAENEETTYVAYVSEQNLLVDDSGGPVDHPQVSELFGQFEDGVYEVLPQYVH